MKKYKKVELVAKNQVAGSYAASCPAKDRGNKCLAFNAVEGCINCERTK